MSATEKGEGPRESDLLAPWRAVERLDARDAALFDRLTAEEPDLAARLDRAAEERDATVSLNEALPSPSPASREKLFARIDAHEAARAPFGAKAGGLGRWLSGRLASFSPATLAWGATAAALVIAVQAGLLAGAYLGDQGGGYETASDGASAPMTRGQTALIAFAPGAKAEDVAKLLEETGAEIVGGPKPGGVFVVRVADKPLADAELAAALKRLGDRTDLVRFVAPGG